MPANVTAVAVNFEKPRSVPELPHLGIEFSEIEI
jgi:hypothetical protein